MPVNFSHTAENIIECSRLYAQDLGHTYIGSEHLLLSLLADTSLVIMKFFSSRKVSYDGMRARLTELYGIGDISRLSSKNMTVHLRSIIKNSLLEATKLSSPNIEVEHILLALLREADCTGLQLLIRLGVNANNLYLEILSAYSFQSEETASIADKSNPNPSTPMLNQYARDLVEEARRGRLDPLIGRENEIKRVIQILSRRTKNNPCLIGEPGVGKTAVVEGLAYYIVKSEVPDFLLDKRIFSLDLSSMVAGAKYRGEFEDRLKNVMKEVKNNSDIIIFIDELHTIIGAGAAEGALDTANILKPILARGDTQVIGATTISEFRKHIEKDAALERRFQQVIIDEPSGAETIEILKGLRGRYETHHKVVIADDAIEAAVSLSIRYLNDRFLPDKALDLLDEASSKARLEQKIDAPILSAQSEKIKHLQEQHAKYLLGGDASYTELLGEAIRKETRGLEDLLNMHSPIITKEDISDIVTSWTGIPIKSIVSEEGLRLINLEEELHKRIVGQHKAIDAIARAIRRGRSGIKDPKRPIASFLFLGPTGVGKTEAVKALAETIFGKVDKLIRFDMSEFMEKHSVSKLIGSPPGYVGYEDEGQLTELVRRKPYSIVLFDEIEKAHSDIYNILLQVLEDGILTDSHGRQVDFKNTIIIMTSNLGSASILSKKTRIGFTSDLSFEENRDEEISEELSTTFRPEFLNRLDEIITFSKLTTEELIEITRRMLIVIQQRSEGIGVKLFFDTSCIEFIADQGADSTYGARPLRRAIQRHIEDLLASQLLKAEKHSGLHFILSEENGVIICKEGELS